MKNVIKAAICGTIMTGLAMSTSLWAEDKAVENKDQAVKVEGQKPVVGGELKKEEKKEKHHKRHEMKKEEKKAEKKEEAKQVAPAASVPAATPAK